MPTIYTYQDLRELALKNNIRDNKVHIGVWIQTQGYRKQRRQINHIRKTFYLKTQWPLSEYQSYPMPLLPLRMKQKSIRYKTTIQIDKAPLKISPELLARLIKAASELDLTPKGRLAKRHKYNHTSKWFIPIQKKPQAGTYTNVSTGGLFISTW